MCLHAVIWAVLCAGAFPAPQDPEELDVLLDRTADRVEEFWGEYTRVTSTEDLVQMKLTPDGKVSSEVHRLYDYLMVMELRGNQPRFEESRIERDAPDHESDVSLLETTGFSTLLLVFHPYFRDSFEFQWSPDDTGKDAIRQVRFQALPGSRSPSVLRLEGRNYPLLWNGTAWIDARSGRVTRIETGLGESMEDLGLRSLTAETEYQSVALPGSEVEYWLPVSSTVEARTARQSWRNEQRFRDYRLFSVESDLEIPSRSEGLE